MVPTVILSRLICVLLHIKLLSLTCKIDSFRSLFLKNGSHYSFVSIQLLLLNVKWIQWIFFHFSQTISGKTQHSGSDFTMHQYLLTELISKMKMRKTTMIRNSIMIQTNDVAEIFWFSLKLKVFLIHISQLKRLSTHRESIALLLVFLPGTVTH